jgi:hypothetical protein
MGALASPSAASPISADAVSAAGPTHAPRTALMADRVETCTLTSSPAASRPSAMP